jgi:hypothetical protein
MTTSGRWFLANNATLDLEQDLHSIGIRREPYKVWSKPPRSLWELIADRSQERETVELLARDVRGKATHW